MREEGSVRSGDDDRAVVAVEVARFVMLVTREAEAGAGQLVAMVVRLRRCRCSVRGGTKGRRGA